MEGGKTHTERQNEAFLLRFQAEGQQKAAIFWEVIALGALVLHILWLAIIFLILATILWLSSIDLEHRADKLWPNPKDWNHEQN